MPLAPPVMTAVLPLSSCILLPFLISLPYATSRHEGMRFAPDDRTGVRRQK
jgi:hypothetical protein